MHLTPEIVLASSRDYYRFMALKATFDNDGIPSKLAPPDQVDEPRHADLMAILLVTNNQSIPHWRYITVITFT